MSINDPHNCGCGKSTRCMTWEGIDIQVCDKCRLVFMYIDDAWLGWFSVPASGRLPGEAYGSP